MRVNGRCRQGGPNHEATKALRGTKKEGVPPGGARSTASGRASAHANLRHQAGLARTEAPYHFVEGAPLETPPSWPFESWCLRGEVFPAIHAAITLAARPVPRGLQPTAYSLPYDSAGTGSGAWMLKQSTRSTSPSVSTRTLPPWASLPKSSSSARGRFSSCWMTRVIGRAP
jgi:hypothetical protein